jgi:hypothetical protein
MKADAEFKQADRVTENSEKVEAKMREKVEETSHA